MNREIREVFVASDGKTFLEKDKCIAHEIDLALDSSVKSLYNSILRNGGHEYNLWQWFRAHRESLTDALNSIDERI